MFLPPYPPNSNTHLETPPSATWPHPVLGKHTTFQSYPASHPTRQLLRHVFVLYVQLNKLYSLATVTHATKLEPCTL